MEHLPIQPLAQHARQRLGHRQQLGVLGSGSPPARQPGASRGFNLRDLFMPRFRGRRDRAEPPATTEGLRAVYVLRDDHPRKVMVKPGDTDGQFTEILSGLKEGDQVITGSSQQGS